MAGRDSRRPGRPSSAEAGFTLIELLVGAAIGLVVLTAGYALLISVARGQPERSNEAASIGEARTTVDRITREVRLSSGVTAATASRVELQTWVNRTSCGSSSYSSTSIECKVVYECAAGACTRAEGPPGGAAGTPVSVVSGLSDSDVFTYSPSATAPTWIGVRLEFAGGDGDDAITVEDGAALRNATLGE